MGPTRPGHASPGTLANIEFLIALLIVVAGLTWLASLVRLPYPVLLVLGGLALGLVPGLPELQLQPDVVFLVFLPPILYQAAFSMSPRELRDNLRPIAGLVVGLLIATLGIVAVIARTAVPGLGWAAAFTLGAVVSPTDPVAATAVFRRLGVRRRLVTVVEGESLVNDGIALVAFNVAAAAMVTGTASVGGAVVAFVLDSVVGVAIGLGVGFVIARVRRRLTNPPVEILVSLFTPYLAFIPAHEAGVSGVLATVAAGVYLGSRQPSGLFKPRTRLEAFAFWNVLVFVLNGILFILVGLQFEQILHGHRPHGTLALVGWGLVLSVVILGARLVWMFVVPEIERALWPSLGEREPAPGPADRLVLGWSAMRGAVTLAAALSVPLATTAGASLGARQTIIFLAFIVILVTLVVPGVTMPWLIRHADVGEKARDRLEVEARLAAVRAALERLDGIAEEGELSEDVIVTARHRYDGREQYLARRLEGYAGDAEERVDPEELAWSLRRLQRELVAAQRGALRRMAREGRLDRALMRRLEREVDLEASRWSDEGVG